MTSPQQPEGEDPRTHGVDPPAAGLPVPPPPFGAAWASGPLPDAGPISRPSATDHPESADPAASADPPVPADPAAQADPAASADPAAPADPAASADPAAPAGPGPDAADVASVGPPQPPPLPRRPTQRRMVRRAPEEPPPDPVDHGPEVGKPSGWLREIPILIAVALGIALLVKTFLVQAFFIPSASMENTLNTGDRVLVNKFAARFGGEVERGHVIVFKDPGGWLEDGKDSSTGNPVVRGLKDVFAFVGLLPSENEKDLIKRVIGVPGDTVACCDAEGRVTVNGVALDEPYLYPGDSPSTREFSVKVPSNRYWVMGDHRSDSADSRAHMDGPGSGTIPAENVVGRAFVLVWPIDRWSGLGVPETFRRPEIDDAALNDAALATSALGLAVLVPMAALRRRAASGAVRRVGGIA